MNTNTTDDTLNDLNDFTTKLAVAIAPYGDGVGLAADHPLHMLKTLHRDMTDQIATARRKRATDARDSDGRPRKTDAPLGEHLGRGARSEPFDDDVAKSWEAVLDAEAELIAVQTGVTIEKAYVAALDKRPDAVRKMYGHPEPDQPVAKGAEPREQAWIEIEGAADRIVQKSRYALSREQAIDRVMKARPDLMRRYYGIEPGPTA